MDLSSTQHEVTRLLQAAQSGDDAAVQRLASLVYDELHAIAQRAMQHEDAGHTLQPTILVHEAFLRLVDQREVSWQNRGQFFALGAQAVRRVLVDHARRRRAIKRFGGTRVTLDESIEDAGANSIDLIALDDALQKLAALDARQARVVELRFFVGLGVEETAEALSISPATVKRDWTFAKAFLQRELDRGEPASEE